MNNKPTIVAVHLLNDYSGSPLVFKQALQGLQKDGHHVVLHTSGNQKGFLSDLDIEVKYFKYHFFKNKYLRLFAFIASQFQLFLQVVKYKNKNVVVYVNTLLPFGAAIAAKLIGAKVIYHIHESYIQPALLKKSLKFIASKTANTALYVSNYLCETERISNINSKVVYNALPNEFVEQANKSRYFAAQQNQFVVLMVCSLKEYKGVYDFISLASRHPHLKFELVLNANEQSIGEYINPKAVPTNITLFSAQSNLDAFYKRASLVVNLTNPELCIETFGMTLLEAMCYGVPVIAPPVGGPTEIVDSGINGFTIDPRQTTALDSTINYLANNHQLCNTLSANAVVKSLTFSSERLQNEVCKSFEGLYQ